MREGMTGGHYMPYYATKIKMKYGCQHSQNLLEIDQIYIHDCGWCTKEYLYDYLKHYPETVVVNIHPYPYLIPALSSNLEKYVRSTPNSSEHDNLLNLPRV